MTGTALAVWKRRVGTLARMSRCVPLGLALAAAGLLARRRARGPQPSPSAQWKPGLSVVVPDRGTPDLLAETLEALMRALARVDEPAEVIVIVNGAARGDYAALCTKYPMADWQFHQRALGFNGAIAAGLKRAHHDWTYLLNSDMRLEPDALLEVLAQRRPWVFAIASQIFFTDPNRRREETGWSDFRPNALTPEVYERDPGPAARMVRGSLYPGGGSSLCRTRTLRPYVRGSADYRPFYWEDADWGVRAWADGWEVLFCPTSRAWHQHRGTIRRYYETAEVDRVIGRNALLFDLRHAWSGRRAGALLRAVAATDARSRAELSGIGTAWRVFCARLGTLRARQRGLRFETLPLDRWYDPAAAPARLPTPRRPRVLLVSPFALFPPAHGGARRVAELIARLRDRVDFLLLGDEGSLYGVEAEPWIDGMLAARFVEGRGDQRGVMLPLEQRLERHVWPGLAEALQRMIDRYDPDIVQVEFMELAGLAATRHGRAKWLLALHDVYLSGNQPSSPQPSALSPDTEAASDAAQRAAMELFDTLTVCSAEDAALLPVSAPVTLIGNGATDRRNAYRPSPDSPRLLFMGPFRYAQNRNGILEFLASSWPVLRDRFPDLVLTILGGAESAEIAAAEPNLRQPGIELVTAFVDPAAYLDQCTLTINPQRDIRGSSIKLIESLLAGRVCVSTSDGARGFSECGLEGLVLAPAIAAMEAPIAALLADHGERRRRERCDDARLDAFTWNTMADRQFDLYRQLLGHPESP
ncbi:MAG TPA: glycosyltransferase [Rudaea sp.]|nr:glycosyltransferase [Rudaea sp.]